MKSKTLRILNGISWLVIGVVALFVVTALVADETGGGTLAAIATVTALTGILWAPILFLIALIAVILEIRLIKKEDLPWWALLRSPSLYVLAALLYVLSLIFLG